MVKKTYTVRSQQKRNIVYCTEPLIFRFSYPFRRALIGGIIMDYENGQNRNLYQIIRKDARNCFIEVKNDSFPIGKIHLEFTAYDPNRPVGERQTNHINIYIDVAEFMSLAHFILYGNCHMKVLALKKSGGVEVNTPLYQSLGGTSVKRLATYGRSRPDGMSLSRNVKLFAGKKADYLFCAESGAGEEDAKGLIVPKYGTHPEQKVSVSLSYNHLNEIMLMTKMHYESYLAAQFYKDYQPVQYTTGKKNGKADVIENGKNSADDTQMF